MSDSFLNFARTSLDSNGLLKKEASATFLDSLPVTLIENFNHQNISSLLANWHGPQAQTTFLKSGFFSGNSGDPVARVVLENETFFFKLFIRPNNAVKEYLASLYINKWNLPHWKHTPITKIGKLQNRAKEEQIYFISKKTKGLSLLQYIQQLPENGGDLTAIESLLKILGTTLKSVHKENHLLFSEQEVYDRIHPSLQDPLLSQKLSKTPFFYTFYNEFQTLLQQFAKNPSYGSFLPGDFHFTNFTFFSETEDIELFDQGSIIPFFSSDWECYHFHDHIIASILWSLLILPDFSSNISTSTSRHLITLFLNAYYNQRFPTLEVFYEKLDLWFRHSLLLTLTSPLRGLPKFLTNIAASNIALYLKNPKAYLAKNFYD